MIAKISGFPEYLPEYQLVFNKIVDTIRRKFELYGFCPLETPAVERISTLLAKGNDNEIYGIYRLTDPNDKKDLALRFDLTVPLARYVSQHADELTFPYRRYHIAPVWRGERPQAGRYRQFYQCDIDIIDTKEIKIANDAEVLSVIYEILYDFGIDFEIKLNNRKILDGLIHYVLGDNADPTPVLRIIDKRDKITEGEFHKQLLDLRISNDQIKKILDFFQIRWYDEGIQIFSLMSSLTGKMDAGIQELRELYQCLRAFGVPDRNVSVDLSLARGLTYYTGNIFETKLRGFDFASSISGGGRYDNLTSLFGKKKYPGVGVTLGITRLIPVLMENGIFSVDKKTPADVLVTTQVAEQLNSYISIANQLRAGGINTEVYLQGGKLGSQMNYANKKGFKYAIIADESELAAGKANIKDLISGEQSLVEISDLFNNIKEIV